MNTQAGLQAAQRLGLLLFSVASLAGCTITQTVNPASVSAGSEVCIVENPEVREGFLPVVKQTLINNGYKCRVVPETTSTNDCPVLMTYVGRWQWDLALYMSYARLQVFENGQPAGDALYDSTMGGGNMSKFIDADEKIQELVEQLFPKR